MSCTLELFGFASGCVKLVKLLRLLRWNDSRFSTFGLRPSMATPAKPAKGKWSP